MALRSPGSNIPQVRSGLLGTYSPNLRQSIRSRMQGGMLGGGAGGMGMDLTELTSKYLQNMPEIDVDTDPMKIYESGMGGLRQDVQGAITEAGRQAISQAASSGREVADVVARYLPEAIKGYGQAASNVAAGATQLAAQGKIAKGELEMKRQGMAQEMARFEQGQAQQNRQFMADLQQKYTLARQQMANNLAVARQQATSAAQLQQINNAHAMQMARMNQQFKMEAEQYSQAQQNMRNSMNLQLYEKWFKGQFSNQQYKQLLDAIKAIQGQPPTTTPGSAGAPTGGGLSTAVGGGSGSVQQNVGPFGIGYEF